MGLRTIAAIGAAVMASTAAAGQDADPAEAAIAAGFRASLACSAMFNAGRSLEEVANLYAPITHPRYARAIASLPPLAIDEARRIVRAPYAEGSPPRLAAWRPHLGCTLLAAGAAAPALEHIAAIELPPYEQDARALPWPDGEALPAPAVDAAPTRLDEVVAAAFDQGAYGANTRTAAIVVVKDGAIAREAYAEGFGPQTPHRVWSVTKSIMATVVGAAQQDGLVDVAAPAPLPPFARPGDPRAAITLENLLHMTSGLSKRGGAADHRLEYGIARSADRAASGGLIAPPGTRFAYSDHDAALVSLALRAAFDDDEAYWRYPHERVLRPIGMRSTIIETDWDGAYLSGSHAWTSARDLARLALLYLNDGEWSGQRVIPRGWAAFVSAPAPAQPVGRDAGGIGYGAHFWLSGGVEGLPSRAYSMRGFRGQFVVIVPEENLAVVRLGLDNEDGGVMFAIERFVADVIAAQSG